MCLGWLLFAQTKEVEVTMVRQLVAAPSSCVGVQEVGLMYEAPLPYAWVCNALF